MDNLARIESVFSHSLEDTIYGLNTLIVYFPMISRNGSQLLQDVPYAPAESTTEANLSYERHPIPNNAATWGPTRLPVSYYIPLNNWRLRLKAEVACMILLSQVLSNTASRVGWGWLSSA